MDSDQMRAGRALLRWTQDDLTKKSGVSIATIKRLEAMSGELVGNVTTLRSLERALTDGGVIFLDAGENAEGGIGVRLLSKSPASTPAVQAEAD